jgi:hypothetical protein
MALFAIVMPGNNCRDLAAHMLGFLKDGLSIALTVKGIQARFGVWQSLIGKLVQNPKKFVFGLLTSAAAVDTVAASQE